MLKPLPRTKHIMLRLAILKVFPFPLNRSSSLFYRSYRAPVIFKALCWRAKIQSRQPKGSNRFCRREHIFVSVLQTSSRDQISVRLTPDTEELLSLWFVCRKDIGNFDKRWGLSSISEMFSMIKNGLEFKSGQEFRGNSLSYQVLWHHFWVKRQG